MNSIPLSVLAAVITGFGLTPAQAQQMAAIQARTTPSGISVTYQLAQPTNEVTFLDPDVIRERWATVTPGMTLKDGIVHSNSPFTTFTILIPPDAAEVDRVYMGLARVGLGYVLYGPGLALKGMVAELKLRPKPGQMAYPAFRAIRGYSYLGPQAAMMRENGATVIVGSDVPAALSKLMRRGFLAAQAFYSARLGRALPYRPAMIVTVDSPGPSTFRGDVTNTGVVSTRFYGKSWNAPTGDALARLSTFIWHETFHLWNGHDITVKDGIAAPWLHEGGAEYGALVAATSSAAVSEQEARSSLTRRLNGCRAAMGDWDYDPRMLRSGSAVYDCGVIIQWIADLEIRQASKGERDIFTLWKTMLDKGRIGGGYGVTDFRSLLVPSSAVSLLLDAPVSTRWKQAEARLKRLGVVLKNQPGQDDYLRTTLFHVIAQNCTGSAGFRNTPDGIKLDTGTRCGALSGDPILATVEGSNPEVDAAAMFVLVQARCAQRQLVRFSFKDGRTVEALCSAPLVEPKAWAIIAAPPLGTKGA